ncbi:hypothetical protein ACFL2H_08860 [Planctomycetota bacterium]
MKLRPEADNCKFSFTAAEKIESCFYTMRFKNRKQVVDYVEDRFELFAEIVV